MTKTSIIAGDIVTTLNGITEATAMIDIMMSIGQNGGAQKSRTERGEIVQTIIIERERSSSSSYSCRSHSPKRRERRDYNDRDVRRVRSSRDMPDRSPIRRGRSSTSSSRSFGGGFSRSDSQSRPFKIKITNESVRLRPASATKIPLTSREK